MTDVRKIQAGDRQPMVLLRRRRWDDFGRSTSFFVRYRDRRGTRILGLVKILQHGRKRTGLPAVFERLGANFCSLGQSLDYYEQIATLPADVAEALLQGLRDIAWNADFARPFANDASYTESLTRFSAAQVALREGGFVLAPLRGQREASRVAPSAPAFRFIAQLVSASGRKIFDSPVEMDFAFARAPLGRIVTLVGRNGAGKTRLLAALARALAGVSVKLARVEPRPALRVLALSYSAFDQFKRPPKLATASYRYWGLRDRFDRLDVERLRRNVSTALEELRAAGRVAILRDALQELGLLKSWGLSGLLRRTTLKSDLRTTVGGVLSRLSAGHQLVFMVACALVADLDRDKIVLFDEPEMHLHPELLTAVMRVLRSLLERFDSFAVLTTHSPIPVQETPARHVRIVELVDERTPIVRRYDGESFGANLGEIEWKAFRVTPPRQNYFRAIEQIVSENGEPALLSMLGENLPISVRVALRTLGDSKRI